MNRRMQLYGLLKDLSHAYIRLKSNSYDENQDILIRINKKFNALVCMYDDCEPYFNCEKTQKKSIFKKYNYDYIKAAKFTYFFVSINLEIMYLIKENRNEQVRKLAYGLHNLPLALLVSDNKLTQPFWHNLKDIYEDLENSYLVEYEDKILEDFKELFLDTMCPESLRDLKVNYRLMYEDHSSDIPNKSIIEITYNHNNRIRAVIFKNSAGSLSIHYQRVQLEYEAWYWYVFDENLFVDTLENARQMVELEMKKH